MKCRSLLVFAGGAAAGLFAPANCPVCGLPLLSMSSHGVCPACLQGIAPLVTPVCFRCGDVLDFDEHGAAGLVAEPTCYRCTCEKPLYEQATAYGSYAGVLRQLIYQYKFAGAVTLAEPLGAMLATTLRKAAATCAEPMTVVAVPLFRRRRSFNQSELLADVALRLCMRSGAAVQLSAGHSLLLRTRRTESQSHLSPAQRRENVRGAFSTRGNVAGKRILLVDDVFTTGATAEECTRVLLRSGARSVRVITLARAHRPLAARWNGGEVWKTFRETTHHAEGAKQ